jgi:hypothetical protein
MIPCYSPTPLHLTKIDDEPQNSDAVWGMAKDDPSKGGEKGLEQRVAALETLLQPFSRKANEVFITGANLHVVNGLGRTGCTDEELHPIPDCPNGLGNLIVGYNEPRSEAFENVRTGSHKVVVGEQHNFSRFGELVVGIFNEISGDYASVSGGEFNTASQFLASGSLLARAVVLPVDDPTAPLRIPSDPSTKKPRHLSRGFFPLESVSLSPTAGTSVSANTPAYTPHPDTRMTMVFRCRCRGRRGRHTGV